MMLIVQFEVRGEWVAHSIHSEEPLALHVMRSAKKQYEKRAWRLVRVAVVETLLELDINGEVVDS